jgi:hypothetical protein
VTLACTVTGASSNAVWFTVTCWNETADDHRIDRRQAREVRRHAPQVGRVAIRQQEHPGERTPLQPFPQRLQRRADARGTAREIQLGEVAHALEPRVEEVTAQVKIRRQSFLPTVRLGGQQCLQPLAPGQWVAGIADLESLAIVGDHREYVGAGAGPLAVPGRFQQAQRQEGDADGLQQHARPAQGRRRDVPVTPPQQTRHPGQQAEHHRQHPAGRGEGEVGERHQDKVGVLRGCLPGRAACRKENSNKGRATIFRASAGSS